jgi:putative NADPH-quinone reductase
MTNIALIDGHPDPDRARFVHALADAYARGAVEGGHEVQRIELATLDFPLLRSREEWEKGKPVPAIAAAQETIAWAEHLVILYPLWLGDMPALLKGFLEQAARPGFAITYGATGPKALLGGRSARVVVTMGMPGFVYRLWFGAHSLKSLKRNILHFAGIRPVATNVIGMVEGKEAARRRWLERMRALGVRAA